MSDFKPYIGPKPKPKPGTLPMDEPEEKAGPPHPAQFADPPFIPADELIAKVPKKERTPKRNLDRLKAVNKQREELRPAVRDDAFDEWVRRYLLEADDPREWTQSAVLYANYLKRAKDYGNNRGDRALVKLALATETRFGILMRDVPFPKVRRARGYFYPVRLKQGA